MVFDTHNLLKSSGKYAYPPAVSNSNKSHFSHNVFIRPLRFPLPTPITYLDSNNQLFLQWTLTVNCDVVSDFDSPLNWTSEFKWLSKRHQIFWYWLCRAKKSRGVLLERLLVPQLFKKFPAFHGNRMFTAVFLLSLSSPSTVAILRQIN